jgi:hypothetical protein
VIGLACTDEEYAALLEELVRQGCPPRLRFAVARLYFEVTGTCPYCGGPIRRGADPRALVLLDPARTVEELEGEDVDLVHVACLEEGER